MTPLARPGYRCMWDRGDAELFEELHEAIARPKRVKISYNGTDGATERVVEPQYLRELIAEEAQKINNMTWDGMI